MTYNALKVLEDKACPHVGMGLAFSEEETSFSRRGPHEAKRPLDDIGNCQLSEEAAHEMRRKDIVSCASDKELGLRL